VEQEDPKPSTIIEVIWAVHAKLRPTPASPKAAIAPPTNIISGRVANERMTFAKAA